MVRLLPFFFLLSKVQPSLALDSEGKIILCVFVPIIVLLVLATILRFWWQFQRAKRKKVSFDPHVDVSYRNFESPIIIEPPKARGKLINEMPKSSPAAKLTDFYPSLDSLPNASDHNPSIPHLEMFYSSSPRKPLPRSSSPFSLGNVNENLITPKEMNKTADRASFQLTPIRGRRSQFQNERLNPHSGKPDFFIKSTTTKRNRNNQWSSARFDPSRRLSLAAGSASTGRLVSISQLVPRSENKRSYSLPTSTSLEVDERGLDRESYRTISELCAQLQESFITYYGSRSKLNTTSMSVMSPRPLKSCLKYRSAPRRTSKHVTFKIKSSVFNLNRKKKSRQKSKTFKAVEVFRTTHKNASKERVSLYGVEDFNGQSRCNDKQTGNTLGNKHPSLKHPSGMETCRGVSDHLNSDSNENFPSLGYYYSVQGDVYYCGHLLNDDITHAELRAD